MDDLFESRKKRRRFTLIRKLLSFSIIGLPWQWTGNNVLTHSAVAALTETGYFLTNFNNDGLQSITAMKN